MGWPSAQAPPFTLRMSCGIDRSRMAAMRDLSIPHDVLNVNGGACALGHPIGASGARVLATLLSALKARGGRKGVAALCIGGGEGVAMAVELV